MLPHATHFRTARGTRLASPQKSGWICVCGNSGRDLTLTEGPSGNRQRIGDYVRILFFSHRRSRPAAVATSPNNRPGQTEPIARGENTRNKSVQVRAGNKFDTPSVSSDKATPYPCVVGKKELSGQ
jgi:hypothetical protein